MIRPVQQAREFWRRLSAGLTLQELWSQFRREAKTSMAVYSAERATEKTGLARAPSIARALFERLSPPRRVLLFAALVSLFIPSQITVWSAGDRVLVQFPGAGLAALIALLLLVLELADRVSMKRDLEIARDIQRLLLPEAPPRVEGIEIAFATRPANTVAGDYYDAFLRPGGSRLFLLVADVAGKGIPAGMLMATLQANVRAFAEEEDLGLADLVSRLNRSTCARSAGGRRFTTAFLAEFDLTTRTLAYVNAGHNPPILMRAAGGRELLDAGGLPLGVFTSTVYASGAVALRPGDALYVYTDGIVEAVNEAGEEYGDDRLESLLPLQAHLSAPEKLASLLASVNHFTGAAAQYDDMTCLILRVDAAGQTFDRAAAV